MISISMKIMEKKIYIQPQAEVLQLVCNGTILIGSAITNGGDGEDGYVEGDGTDQLSGEYRGDWDNIWGDM